MHLSKTKNISGAVVTEMVIVMPVVLLLMAAIVQFSVFFVDKLQLNYAAYQCARNNYFIESEPTYEYTTPAWKDAMPGAHLVSSRSFLLDEKHAGIGVGLCLVRLQYESPVLIPLLFEATGQNGIESPLELEAVNFAPSIN